MMATLPLSVHAAPEEGLKAFQTYYEKRFPDTPREDFVNGVYSTDPTSREQWKASEEFPPYEINIENGEQLFEKPFKNGKTYVSCFKNGGIGIKNQYPYFDTKSDTVKALAQEINEYRALEYFHTYISNGLEWNDPGARK